MADGVGWCAARRRAALGVVGGAATALAASFGAAEAVAGTRVATETHVVGKGSTGQAPARTEHASAWIDGRRLRVDANGGKSTVIYRGDEDSAFLLDHAEKTYVKVDRGTTVAVSRKVEEANREMRERLAGLPPEQRAAMEKLLDGTLGPAPDATPPVSVRSTGERDLVEGIPCDESEVVREGQRVALVCTASFQAAGVSAATFDVVRELAVFLRESVASLAPGTMRQEGLDALEGVDRLQGVPLRVRAYEKGRLQSETVVKEIAEEAVPAARFDVPAGYRGGFSIGDLDAPAEP
jgi:hypothetical protein